MDDTISRQAAIDATSEIVFVEYEDGDPRKEESIILQTKAAIRDRIKALPPVYVPDMNDGDMISRQAAMDAVEKYACNTQRTYEAIKNLPPVQPNHNAEVSKMEIIHCKDCKYWKEKPLYTYCEKMYRMGILDVLDYATEKNDFCSMAEKRGGEDDKTDCDYERAVEQLEHDMLYEPTFDPDDGSM